MITVTDEDGAQYDRIMDKIKLYIPSYKNSYQPEFYKNT
jgi:hypothetical protein